MKVVVMTRTFQRQSQPFPWAAGDCGRIRSGHSRALPSFPTWTRLASVRPTFASRTSQWTAPPCPRTRFRGHLPRFTRHFLERFAARCTPFHTSWTHLSCFLDLLLRHDAEYRAAGSIERSRGGAGSDARSHGSEPFVHADAGHPSRASCGSARLESGSGPRTRRGGTVRCLRARSCFERRQEGSAARRWTCANADVEVDPRGSSVPATSIETFESLIDIFPDKISNEDRCVWTPSTVVGWDERRHPSEWNRVQGVLQANMVQRGAQDLLLERLMSHTWEAYIPCGCRRERRTTRTSWIG